MEIAYKLEGLQLSVENEFIPRELPLSLVIYPNSDVLSLAIVVNGIEYYIVKDKFFSFKLYRNVFREGNNIISVRINGNYTNELTLALNRKNLVNSDYDELEYLKAKINSIANKMEEPNDN